MENGVAFPFILQEVIGCTTCNVWFSTTWGWVKLQKRIFKLIVKFHNGGLISTAIAVVGSRKDSDDVSIMTPVVPFHYKLMGSRDQSYTVRVVKSLGNILTKSISSSTRRNSPTPTVIRIRPEQITHRTFVRHFLEPVQCSYMIQSVNARTQSTMEAEDLLVDKCSQR